MTPNQRPEEELPVRPGTSTDPSSPREIESPGDPGPTVLVPAEDEPEDPRRDPKLPEEPDPAPGV